MYEKKKKSLPLIEYEPEPGPAKLSPLIESICEEAAIPEGLREIAEAVPVPMTYQEGGNWHLDYKGWRLVFGSWDDLRYYQQRWINIIDNGWMHVYDVYADRYVETPLERIAELNAGGRSLCACAKFASCVAVRLVRRI